MFSSLKPTTSVSESKTSNQMGLPRIICPECDFESLHPFPGMLMADMFCG